MEDLKDKTIIHLKREFACKAEPLFESFLSAEEFRSWFCPPGFEPGNFTVNPYPGGEYRCEFLKGGEFVLTIKGKYTEILKYTKLIFTLMYEPDAQGIGECKVTVTFNEKDDNTTLVLNQEIFQTIDAEGRTKGWEFMFTKLDKILNNIK